MTRKRETSSFGSHTPDKDKMKSLAGRTAFVTGASRGIGAEISRKLVAEGARVALAARNWEALEKLAEELGENAVPIECDVTDQLSVVGAGARAREAFGSAPEIVVNNAGAFRVAPIESMSPEDFIATVSTGLIGPFLILHEFLAEMRERKSGHVITIGSAGDRQIFPGNAGYNAAKFGLRAMHEVMRLELRGTGVRATLISPSSVNTELWDDLDADTEAFSLPERKDMMHPNAVTRAVIFALTQPASVNIDELRLSRA
jgi:NADP-dependent 3-hydroxy acid dehydrogenase YdfG